MIDEIFVDAAARTSIFGVPMWAAPLLVIGAVLLVTMLIVVYIMTRDQ